MKKIEICIIGSGRIFQLYHLSAIINSGYFNIKYVVDKNEKIAVKNAKEVGAEALFDSNEVKDCEVFFIATPPNTRKNIFDSIKDKAKYIIFEKPIAFSYDEVAYMVEECKKRSIICMVAQTRRFFPNLNFIKDLVSNGFISSPFKLKIYEGAPFGWLTESNYLMKTDSKDNGVIHDVGAHVYDYMISLIEEFGEESLDITTEKTLVDYESLPNNVQSFHTVKGKDYNGEIDIKLSRSILLMNKLVLTDGKSTIISRPLLDSSIKIKKGNKEFLVQVPEMTGKTYKLNNAFDDMWKHIGISITNEECKSLIDITSVTKTVKLMDNIIQQKEIKSIDNYFKNFGNEE